MTSIVIVWYGGASYPVSNRGKSMKMIRVLFAMMVMTASAIAATTTLSGSSVDSDGIAWAGGSYTLTFVYNAALGTPVVNGQAFALQFTGTLDGTGSFSQAVTSTTGTTPVTTPPASGWAVTVCPAIASSTCYTTAPLAVTGSTQSVTAQISAIIKPPRITAIGIPSAYADIEVPAFAGNQYYRVTDSTYRCYTTTWGDCGSGSSGGAAFPATAGVVCNTSTTASVNCSGGQIAAAIGTTVITNATNATSVGGISVSGTPSTGQVPTATSATAATWQTPTPGSSGISGLTTGQVPIAGSATTVTSSKPLAGAGAAITTGPSTSTSGDLAVFTGTAGQVTDGAIAGSSIVRTAASNPTQALGPNTILNGDSSTLPGTGQVITSTNSGSTSGIPVGFTCWITHTFVSGTNYIADATCASLSAVIMWYSSATPAPVGSEAFTQKLSLNTSGNIAASGTISGSNIHSGEFTQTSTTTALTSTPAMNTVTLAADYVFTLAAGAAGQQMCLQFIQGPTTAFNVTPPANVRGFFTVGTTLNKANVQCYLYSSQTTAWMALDAGNTNE